MKTGKRSPAIAAMRLSIWTMIGALVASFSIGLMSDAEGKKQSRFAEVRNRISPKLKRELSAKKLTLGSPIFIRTFKESDELELWVHDSAKKRYRLFKKYRVYNWGGGSLGPKLKQGDRQAPEGFYSVARGQMNPQSRFHLSFNLGYPNTYDRSFGRTGNFLMVHGAKVSIGCYAMSDEKIEEIYTLADAALRGGQKRFWVHCFPFRMTAERMAKAKSSKWAGFWRDLKVGYDAFEKTGRTPSVSVSRKRYVVKPR